MQTKSLMPRELSASSPPPGHGTLARAQQPHPLLRSSVTVRPAAAPATLRSRLQTKLGS